ncbi:MAG: hypothetical protein ACM3JP_00625 [Betaproteobacteria bacterium]
MVVLLLDSDVDTPSLPFSKIEAEDRHSTSTTPGTTSRVRTGALYARGLRVWATFRTHINHFDVQLAAPSREQVELFLEAAGALQDNPYWRKERA